MLRIFDSNEMHGEGKSALLRISRLLSRNANLLSENTRKQTVMNL